MNKYMNNLKNKYGYSDELLNFLNKLIPCLIVYYGEEYKKNIFDALMNCEIHFQDKNENSEAFLNEYFNINEELEIPFFAGAFYQRKIYLKNHQLSEKSIIYVVTGGPEYYTPFKFDVDRYLDKLIHEILHLVKGYGKLQLDEDHIIARSGLIKDFYTYDSSDCITFDKKQNDGIEEAFNCVEASQILELMTGRKQEIRGYTKAGEIAKAFLENDDFAHAIRKSQFDGSDSWIQFLGEAQSEVLIKSFEILVMSKYASFKILNTPEKIKKFNNSIQEAIDSLNEVLGKFILKNI